MSDGQNTGIRTPWLAVASRIDSESHISDNAYYDSLVKSFEFLTKYIATVLISVLPPEYNQSRYLWEHKLVRASSLGPWRDAIRQLSGGAFSTLSNRFSSLGYSDAIEQLTIKVKEGQWQHEVTKAIIESKSRMLNEQSNVPSRTSLLVALDHFVEFRNKDAHGASKSAAKSSMASHLEEAKQQIEDNLSLLKIPLIICRKTIKGRASSVVPTANVCLTQQDCTQLGYLHKDSNESDGLFILDNHKKGNKEAKIYKVRLIEIDEDRLEEYYIANGSLRQSDWKAEWLNYASGQRKRISIKPWRARPPSSETSAYDELIYRGNILTNAPELPDDYINRHALQEKLEDALERRQIITLKGSGGIGKTSLALWAVHRAGEANQFDVVLWFSSRDIDLRPGGAYEVDPDVTTVDDICKTACKLLEDTGTVIKRSSSSDIMLQDILHSHESGRVLWVLDNFETVKDQKSVFDLFDQFIYHHKNNSHKLLITTRHRFFQGDYSVQVDGMSKSEFDSLVQKEMIKFSKPLQDNDIERLFRKSNGHPYIAKIVLGGMKRGISRNPTSILGKKENILDALFERTFEQLSNDARHVYLLLCKWNNLISLVALDLTVNSKNSDTRQVDVYQATDELIDYSLIECQGDEQEQSEDWIWFNVPTPSRIFGRKKLIADPLRFSIEKEFQQIQRFGVCTPKDVMDQVRPVKSFWFSIREDVIRQLRRRKGLIDSLGEWYPWFDRLGSSVPQLWSWLAQYLEETGRSLEAEKFYRRAISAAGASPGKSHLPKVMLDLANYLEEKGRYKEALETWVYRACSSNSTFDDLSHAANKVNGWIYRSRVSLTKEERKVLLDELVKTMEDRSKEADAQDFSRLAWLYVQMGDIGNGVKAAKRGLSLDYNQRDCRNFLVRFGDKQ